MSKCLITKLDVSVNNDTLPIFESMSSFATNLISKSGNATMTEDQKWAVNHMCYAIGAVNNSTLYSKFKLISLPIIAKDIDHAGINYVDGANLITSTNKSKVKFENGVIVSNETVNCLYSSNYPSMSISNFSSIEIYPESVTGSRTPYTIEKSGNSIASTVYLDGSTYTKGISINGSYNAIYTKGIYRSYALSLSGEDASDWIAFTSSVDTTEMSKLSVTKTVAKYNNVTVESGATFKSLLSGVGSTSAQALIIAEALTETELKNAFEAVKAVVKAFAV